MGESASATVRHEPEQDVDQPVGGNELAQGLLLVRASAMNVARLHLAAESMDRRRMLESMDDLVALDRKIGKFVADIPTSDSGIDALQNALEEQRRELAREKLSMGAGISLRRDREAEEPVIARGTEDPAEATDDPVDDDDQGFSDDAPQRRRGKVWAAVAALLLVMVLAVAAFLYVTGEWRGLLERLS